MRPNLCDLELVDCIDFCVVRCLPLRAVGFQQVSVVDKDEGQFVGVHDTAATRPVQIAWARAPEAPRRPVMLIDAVDSHDALQTVPTALPSRLQRLTLMPLLDVAPLNNRLDTEQI